MHDFNMSIYTFVVLFIVTETAPAKHKASGILFVSKMLINIIVGTSYIEINNTSEQI